MARLRYDNLSAALGASLSDSATSATLAAALEFGDGTPVPTLAGDDYFTFTILGAGGVVEVVYVTGYTSAGTSMTIARGQEGTDAVAHADGTDLRHSPTALDFHGNILIEVSGAYPDRADATTTAVFAGTTDPGPDGLDIMVEGDVWLDATGDDTLADHVADTTAAHAASAIAFTPAGTIAATTVQAAIEEVASEAGGGSGSVATDTIFNAKGDLAVGTGSDTAIRRAVGSNGQVLTADSAETDGVKWATPAGATYVGVKAYRSASYSMANITDTAVPWDAEEWDTDAFHDNSTNNTRFTVPSGQAGKYSVSLTVGSDAGWSATRFFISLKKNGTIIRGGLTELGSYNAGVFPTHNLTCEVDLAVGDYVEGFYYQGSGSTRNMYLAVSAMSMHKIG
jgi:hypothetical protein